VLVLQVLVLQVLVLVLAPAQQAQGLRGSVQGPVLVAAPEQALRQVPLAREPALLMTLAQERVAEASRVASPVRPVRDRPSAWPRTAS
jgi:hypothetical protein